MATMHAVRDAGLMVGPSMPAVPSHVAPLEFVVGELRAEPSALGESCQIVRVEHPFEQVVAQVYAVTDGLGAEAPVVVQGTAMSMARLLAAGPEFAETSIKAVQAFGVIAEDLRARLVVDSRDQVANQILTHVADLCGQVQKATDRTIAPPWLADLAEIAGVEARQATRQAGCLTTFALLLEDRGVAADRRADVLKHLPEVLAGTAEQVPAAVTYALRSHVEQVGRQVWKDFGEIGDPPRQDVLAELAPLVAASSIPDDVVARAIERAARTGTEEP